MLSLLRESDVLQLFEALLEVDGQMQVREIREHAESMAALAQEHGIALCEVEQNWIRYTPSKDRRSLAAFRRWCQDVQRLREQTIAPPPTRELPFRICPCCYAETAQRYGNRWICPMCGEVE
jgi:hypothetical protein